MEIAIRNYDGLIVRAHSISVWRPAGIKLQRQTHVSTRHGSATRTRSYEMQFVAATSVQIRGQSAAFRTCRTANFAKN